ncbi:MAG: pyrroline-5-carboxylate reductase [Acidaminococcales bacterium]|jgi:pyrroline-5-carboxylate reductase|nr:pyrroline-5-carboxylate reductase [Acidaminococcales bacterium]
MQKDLLFIGGGVMAEAIIKGILAKSLTVPEKITVIEPLAERRLYLEKTYGVRADNESEALKRAQAIILAVKPQILESALDDAITALIPHDALVVSIVAGKSLAGLRALLPRQRLVRVMPNTPLAVGEGMTVFARDKSTNEHDVEFVHAIFAACGMAMELPESQLDAVTGLSGSGPGYIFVIIDALADAGVMAGLPRDTAIKLAAQTLAGSARMVLETGKHPAQLRDQVTSPGGTTIAGIAAMEKAGVRAGLMGAVLAATEKSRSFREK